MKKLALLFFLAAFVAFLLITPRGNSMLAGAGRWLVVTTPQRRVDLIVALGGDRGRQEAAADLLGRDRGHFLLFVGADARQRDYACLNLPAPRCLPVPPPAWTTGEEAAEVAGIMRSSHFNSVLIVTSPTHSRRALWIFRRALRGTGVEVLFAPSPNPAFPIDRWWKFHMGVKSVVTEYFGLGYYWVKGYL